MPPAPFEPASEEALFLKNYAKQYASHRRSAAFLAVMTWLAYVPWDFYHMLRNPQFADIFPTVITLRIIGLVLLGGFYLNLKRRTYLDDARMSRSLIMMVIIAYAILTLMTVYVINFSVLYYIGLLLILLFLYGLLRIRAKGVALTSAICLAITLSSIPFFKVTGTPGGATMSYYFTAALMYLSSFMVIGIAVSVQLERAARDGFMRERRLQLVRSELATSNRSLTTAQIETAAKTRALLAAKDEVRIAVEQQNRDKSRFLASAAHDLRQPMQALSNLLEAAAHAVDNGDMKAGSQMLAMAREASSLSRTTFNSVLDISRLESGFVEASYSNFDIHALLSEIVAGHAVQASFSGTRIRYRQRSGAAPVLVHSDRHLLGRVIANLLSNALKYSDDAKAGRCSVVVGAVPFGNRVRIDIVDNGIGISRGEWDNIFRPFVQLSNNERDRSKGVGLGLSIVQASIAILAGHRLDMSSVPGRGTRFSIEVPPAKEGYDLHHAEPPDARFDGLDLEGTYVLYVEDDPLVRQSTLAMFERFGLRSEAFGSVADLRVGLERMEMPPDIIITDYRLPADCTATDVIDAARATFETELPVLVMTGEVNLTARPGWRVLHKPVAPHVLLAAISAQLARRPVASE